MHKKRQSPNCISSGNPTQYFWIDKNKKRLRRWQQQETGESREIIHIFSDRKHALVQKAPWQKPNEAVWTNEVEIAQIVSPGVLRITQSFGEVHGASFPSKDFDGFMRVNYNKGFFYSIYNGDGKATDFPIKDGEFINSCYRNNCIVSSDGRKKSELRSKSGEILLTTPVDIYHDFESLLQSRPKIVGFIEQFMSAIVFLDHESGPIKSVPDLTNLMQDANPMSYVHSIYRFDEPQPEETIAVPFRNKMVNRGFYINPYFDWEDNFLDGTRYSTKQSLVDF